MTQPPIASSAPPAPASRSYCDRTVSDRAFAIFAALCLLLAFAIAAQAGTHELNIEKHASKNAVRFSSDDSFNLWDGDFAENFLMRYSAFRSLVNLRKRPATAVVADEPAASTAGADTSSGTLFAPFDVSLLNNVAMMAGGGTASKISSPVISDSVAPDLYWRTDGTSATWTGSNWSGSPSATGGTAWTSGDDAFFTANSTVTFATTSIGDVTVSDNRTVNVSPGGSTTLTFAPNGTVGVSVFDIGTGSTMTWQSQTVTSNSAGGYTKNGAGTLDLGALTWSTHMNGGVTLNAGTLIVSGNKALGDGSLTLTGGTLQTSGTRAFTPTSIVIGGDFALSGSGNSNWDAATTIALGSATRTITNNTTSGSRQFRGLISGNSGAGLTFAGNGSAQIYIGNTGNTFSGPISITGGEVDFNDNGSLGNTSNSITIDGGRLTMASMDTSGNASALTAATISSSHNIFVGDGAATSISVSGSTGVTTYNGVIADAPTKTGSWAKQGAGVLQLGGQSTYSGSTSINNGTLKLDSAGSTTPRLAGTTLITANSGGTLLLANSVPATPSTDRINNASGVTVVGGGIVNTGGFSEGTRPSTAGAMDGAVGVGALTLQTTSSSSRATIDFLTGANGSSLVFSSLAAASSGAYLDLKNWTGSIGIDNGATGNDRLLFASIGSLGTADLANVAFYNDAGALLATGGQFIPYGNLYEVVPIPEPSTWAAAGLALVTVAVTARRRFRRSATPV